MVTPAVPATPTDLAARLDGVSGHGAATVVLTWAVPLTSVVGGFTLHRATSSGFTTGVTTLRVPGSARSFTDTGLARDTVYHYRIQAGNAAGTSVVSRSVSIRTPA
ncbi:hypothetical protein GCM10027615_33800 [Plantactinospora veratri]